MMKIYSKIHVLTEDETTYKKIFAVANEEDVMVSHSYTFSDIPGSIYDYDAVFAEFNYLKYLREDRDRVVVIKPGAYTRRLISAGYSKFLTDTNDKNTILISLCHFERARKIENPDFEKDRVIDEEQPVEAKRPNSEAEFKGLYMNFVEGTYKYKGEDLYLTAAEKKYLYFRFCVEDKKSSHRFRIQLYRMRKKFGEEFLK